MGWFWFLLFLVVVAGGIYLYQRLLAIEQEIRQEQQAQTTEKSNETPVVKVAPVVEPIKEGITSSEQEESDEPVSLEESLLTVINDLPGLLQTELYALFPDSERKKLQTLLLKLDRNGLIRREKKNSSYRVFPV